MLKELEQLRREKSDFEKFQKFLERKNPNRVNSQPVAETYFQAIKDNLKEYKSLPNQIPKVWKKTISFHAWSIEKLRKDGCSEGFLTYLEHVKIRNKKHKFYLDNSSVSFKYSKADEEYAEKRISELDQMINIISSNNTENENGEVQTRTGSERERTNNSRSSASTETDKEISNDVTLEGNEEEDLSSKEQFTGEEIKREETKNISSNSSQAAEGNYSSKKGHKRNDSTDSGYNSDEKNKDKKSVRSQTSRITRITRKRTYDNLKNTKKNFEKDLAIEKNTHQKTKRELTIEQKKYQNLYRLFGEIRVNIREQEQKKINDELINIFEKYQNLLDRKNFLGRKKEELTKQKALEEEKNKKLQKDLEFGKLNRKSLQERVNNLHKENKELYKELKEVISEKEQEAKKINDELINISEKNLELFNRNTSLTKKLKSKDEKIQIRLRNKRKECREIKEQFGQERKAWTKQKTELEDEILVLAAYQEQLETKNNKLVKDLNTERAEHQKTYRLYLDEEQKATNLTNDCANLSTEIATKNTELTEKNNQITDLSNDINNLNDTLTREKQDFSDELTQKNAQIQKLVTQLASQGNNIQNLQTELENAQTKESQQIIEQLDSSLNLNLPENTDLDQAITIIKELIAKPPNITIDDNLVKQTLLKSLSEIKETDLQWLKGILSQQLFMVAEEKYSKQEVTNYQQLAEMRNGLIQEQLFQSQGQLQTVSQQKTSLAKQKNILWLLLAIGLLGIAITTGKLRKSRILNKKYIQDNHSIKEELEAMRKEMRIFMSTILNNRDREKYK